MFYLYVFQEFYYIYGVGNTCEYLIKAILMQEEKYLFGVVNKMRRTVKEFFYSKRITFLPSSTDVQMNDITHVECMRD